MRMPISSAMIPMTTKSSTRVNPGVNAEPRARPGGGAAAVPSRGSLGRVNIIGGSPRTRLNCYAGGNVVRARRVRYDNGPAGRYKVGPGPAPAARGSLMEICKTFTFEAAHRLP